MRAWVIKTGEPVPYLPVESDDRLFRAGLMAQTLVDAGHEVTWWTAQFHHQFKHHRDVQPDRVLRPSEAGPDMVFLSSRGYRSHVTPARFLDHAQVRRGFLRLARNLPRPDVIICAWPTIDLAYAATTFGRAHGIPVVLDIRDLWPDIFYERIAAKTGLPFKGYFWPWERMGKRAMQNANAVISITQGMLDWAHTRFARETTNHDRVFYQSQSATPAVPDAEFWQARRVDLAAPKTRLVWSGTLISELDIQTLLAAIETLPQSATDKLEFVFCGLGDLTPRIEEMAARLPHMIYAGWVSQNALSALYEASHIGMMCYLDRFDFQLSIPNKVADFTRSGLRVLTNLDGELGRVLGPHDILIRYKTGDADDLGAVLRRIADEPERYRGKTDAGRRIFSELFDAKVVMADFVRHVEGIACQGAT